MADESEEVNTAVEDVEANQQSEEVPEAEPSGECPGSDAPEAAETTAAAPAPAPASDGGWSGPLLSLARRATETISSGVSYAAAPRNHSQSSAASSPTDKEPENEVSTTGKKLPGLTRLLATLGG